MLRRLGVNTIRSGQAAHGDAAAAAEYALGAYRGFVASGPLDSVGGARVLEIGPGDNLGLGLAFLAHGAEEVVAVDRFAVQRDPAVEAQVYRELAARLPEGPRERASSLLTGGRPPIEWREGVTAEHLDEHFGAERFDIILSVAVCEHLLDVERALGAMLRVLAPGGVMLHQVDLRDHGMFTGAGFSPLEFLTVRDGLYRRMSRHTGRPNRVMVDAYRRMLDALGSRHRISVNLVAGHRHDLPAHADRLIAGAHFTDGDSAMVAAIRPRLLPRYRDLPQEDLLAGGIFVRAWADQGPMRPWSRSV